MVELSVDGSSGYFGRSGPRVGESVAPATAGADHGCIHLCLVSLSVAVDVCRRREVQPGLTSRAIINVVVVVGKGSLGKVIPVKTVASNLGLSLVCKRGRGGEREALGD